MLLNLLTKSVNRLLMAVGVAILGACDFAPSAIVYDLSQVESEDEIYDLLADYQTAAAVAQMIDAFCPSLDVDETSQLRHKDWIETETIRYFDANPAGEDAFLARIGSDAVSAEGYFEGRPGFDLPISGNLDMLGRAGSYFVARGFPVTEEGLCRAGRAEIAQTTLVGSFLMPAGAAEEGVFAIPQFAVPEAEQ